MKLRDFLNEINCDDLDREVIIVLEFDPNDLPDFDGGDISFAPREVSARLKNARQFNGEDKNIIKIYITGSDY